MNILESFKSAIFNILSSKMRTFLTTLGIIIGITAVIVITSVGKGFENNIHKTFSTIDSGAISLTTSSSKKIRDKDKFTLDDIEDLKKIEDISYISPVNSTNVSVKLKDPQKTKSATLEGRDEDGKGLNSLTIKYGRYLTQKDIDAKAKVCVIDKVLAKEIFGREDVIGEKIKAETVFGKIKDIELEVVGVYDIKTDGFYTPSIHYPIKTSFDFLGNTTNLFDSISLKLKDTNTFNQTKKSILKILTANHDNNEDMYSISGSFDLVNSMEGTVKIVTIFIGLVASVSLLVGGIGVMNIMLVTVTERTREIGIRKSLGATNNNIKIQFLIEAITVALMGGVLGVIFGYIGSFLCGKVVSALGFSLKPDVSMQVVIGSVLISTIIGVIFGVYPAGKAAKLDPIEALRYE